MSRIASCRIFIRWIIVKRIYDTIDTRLKLREKCQKDLVPFVTKREIVFTYQALLEPLLVSSLHKITVRILGMEQATRQSPVYQIIKYAGELVDSLAQMLSTRGIRTGIWRMNMSYGTFKKYRDKFGDTSSATEGMIETFEL